MKIGGWARSSKAVERAVGDDQLKGGGEIRLGESLQAGAVGLGLGAGLGALEGYVAGRHQVAHLPVESVTLTWNEPVTHEVSLGSIPLGGFSATSPKFDQCLPGGAQLARLTLLPAPEVTQSVSAPSPVLDQAGNPVFQEVTRTFTGHGQAIVDVQEHRLSIPSLDPNHPFVEHSSDVSHPWQCTDWSTGEARTYNIPHLDGVKLSYEPNLQELPLNQGQYETRTVHFDSGVDVVTRALDGALFGAGLGAVLAVAGDLARQTLAARSR